MRDPDPVNEGLPFTVDDKGPVEVKVTSQGQEDVVDVFRVGPKGRKHLGLFTINNGNYKAEVNDPDDKNTIQKVIEFWKQRR